jgi:hypothetical protein
MLSLEVCLLCDDDGCEGVGSGVGLSRRSDLEAIFYTAVSKCWKGSCRQRTRDGTYDRRQVE